MTHPFTSEPPPPREHRSPGEGAPQRILVVDDNSDGAQTLGHLLRVLGHEVRVELTSLDGVSAARSFAPQVVLLDLGLPDMDGFEVARQLRRMPETADALLVALTGYGRDEDRRRSREAGFDHHVVKPADIEVLRHLLAEAAAKA